MSALLIATIACVVANASIAVVDYTRAEFVVTNSAQVHVPAWAVPYLATVKLAGAIGLVVGLTAFAWLGVAAAIGLVLFFIGAVIAHLRASVYYNIAFPGLYLLLAIAATVFMLRHATG
ncbi:DoxX family protein [Nocardia callitridis]|uniref:DoxX family protein n=1 Tax=Nocardia callitridis TaxID=648753 RepID=A0ABP9KN43_9NOCA